MFFQVLERTLQRKTHETVVMTNRCVTQSVKKARNCHIQYEKNDFMIEVKVTVVQKE